MKHTQMNNWLVATALVTLPAGFACGEQLAGSAAELTAPLEQVAAQPEAASDFSYSIGFGFESMFVCSGSQAAYATFQPEVALEYKGIYLVLAGFLPLNNSDYANEYDLSAGYALDIEDIVTVSLGGTYYMYPDNRSEIKQKRELNFEVALNTLLTPMLALNYDFDCEQTEVIVGISYDFDLAELAGVEGLSVSTACWYGYVQANNVNATSSDKEKDGYGYVQATANVVYAANETLSLYAGPRLAYNNNGKETNISENETKVWFGAGAVWSF